MITRRVRVQLLGLLLVTVLGVGYVGFRYAGLHAATYPVHLQPADSGGIFTGADVTYRGVSVGRVGPLTLTASGVDVQLDIDATAPAIPADVDAAVRDLSPIGEQYVDLRPRANGRGTLASGGTIPPARTSTPVGVEDLVGHLDTLVRSVPLDSLRTVVSELGIAFADSAQPLRRLLDTTSEFTQAGQDALPQTVALLHDARTVLTTQNATAGEFGDFSRSLAQLADQLKTSDPDIRRLVRNGPPAADQISGLLDESGSGLGDVVANLLTVSRIAEPPQSNLEQILVVYPGVSSVAPRVVPGDGTAHLGLVLNVFDPPPCTKGYEATPRRAGNEVADTPVNAQAHCAEPYNSPIDVRGAQNVPQRGDGRGDPAAGDADDQGAGGAHRTPSGPAAPLPPPALPGAPLPMSSPAQILLP
jgi:phospholipid/cholesterol/gamma-HCH transport system substrate-binding protein